MQFSTFQFHTIGKGETDGAENPPALLKRLSSANNADFDPHGEQHLSPQGPSDQSNDGRISETTAASVPNSDVSLATFSSAPSNRPTLMQTLNPAQVMLDANSSAQSGPKTDIFGQKFAFSLAPDHPARVNASLSNNSNAAPQTSSSSSAFSAQSLTSSPAIQIEVLSTSPSLSGSADNLLYPQETRSVSRTPQHNLSPVIQREPTEASVSLATNVDDSSSTSTQGHAPAISSAQASIPSSIAPFANLKEMHARLIATVKNLNKQASSNTSSSSMSLESPITSVLTNLASARKFAQHAQTLAQQSIASAGSASTALSASIAAAKESLDVANKARALVEAGVQALTEHETRMVKITAEMKADTEKMGEWISDRERDRERRLRKEREEREKREKEAEEREKKEKEKKEKETEKKEREEKEKKEREEKEKKKREEKGKQDREAKAKEGLAREKVIRQKSEQIASSTFDVNRSSDASSGTLPSRPSSLPSDQVSEDVPDFQSASLEDITRKVAEMKALESATKRAREEAEMYCKRIVEEKELRERETAQTNKDIPVNGRRRRDSVESQAKEGSHGFPPSSRLPLPLTSPAIPSVAHFPSVPQSLPPKPVVAQVTTNDSAKTVVSPSEMQGLEGPSQRKKARARKSEERSTNRTLSGNVSLGQTVSVVPEDLTPQKLATLQIADAYSKSKLQSKLTHHDPPPAGARNLQPPETSSTSSDVRAINRRHDVGTAEKRQGGKLGKNAAYRGYDIPKLVEEESSVTQRLPAPPPLPAATSRLSSGANSSQTLQGQASNVSKSTLASTTGPKSSSADVAAPVGISGQSLKKKPVFNTLKGVAKNKPAPSKLSAKNSASTGVSAPKKNATQSQKLVSPALAAALHLRSPSPIAPNDGGWANVQVWQPHREYVHHSPSPRSKSPSYLSRSSLSATPPIGEPSRYSSSIRRHPARSSVPNTRHSPGREGRTFSPDWSTNGQARDGRRRSTSPWRSLSPAPAYAGAKRSRVDNVERYVSPPHVPSEDLPIDTYRYEDAADSHISLGSRLSNGYGNTSMHEDHEARMHDNEQHHQPLPSRSKRPRTRYDNGPPESPDTNHSQSGLLARISDGHQPSNAQSQDEHRGQSERRGRGRGRGRGRATGHHRDLSTRIQNEHRSLADRLGEK